MFGPSSMRAHSQSRPDILKYPIQAWPTALSCIALINNPESLDFNVINLTLRRNFPANFRVLLNSINYIRSFTELHLFELTPGFLLPFVPLPRVHRGNEIASQFFGHRLPPTCFPTNPNFCLHGISTNIRKANRRPQVIGATSSSACLLA